MSTKHTICDQEKELQTKQLLNDIAHDLKTHFLLEKDEIVYQKKLIQTMQAIVSRYKMLERGAPGVSLYPDYSVDERMCELKNQMCDCIKDIFRSNEKLEDSLSYITPLYQKLNSLDSELDWTVNHPTMKGSCEMKPLRYYVECVADLRNRFKKNTIDRQVIQNMLDLECPITVDIYEDLLEQQGEYEESFTREIFFSGLLDLS